MIITGDCRETLKTLPAESVQTCVTSPPYFGLRDYGNAAQIGLEETPEQYVAQLVEVFREVRRVLRDDGTLWLNLGDSYAGPWGNQGRKPERGTQRPINGAMIQQFGKQAMHALDCDMDEDCTCGAPMGAKYPDKQSNTGKVPTGWKPKDLFGIPWRVAFALQADGWWLRQDIIWAKPNPMPESIKDRCTKAHEYVFLLSKSASYFYDCDSIREPHKEESVARVGRTHHTPGHKWETGPGDHTIANDLTHALHPMGRNKRSVWTIPTRPYAGAHFATMPPELAALCIQAGSRIGDTVLDPFLGSGTTGEVAESLGRRWVGCELNPEYVEQAKVRTAQMGLLPIAN